MAANSWPDAMLHIDTKKIGRIARAGNRRDSVDGAGWETPFVAVDDHARIAYTAMYPDIKEAQAEGFLRDVVAYYAGLR